MNEYEEAAAALPGIDRGAEIGIMTVIIRLAEHLGYMIAHVTDKPLTEEDQSRLASDDEELDALRNHVGALAINPDTVSTTMTQHIRLIRRLMLSTPVGWHALTDEQRTDRLTDVSNHLAALGAALDVELTGIPARAGSSL